jgi:two-component sensor histidine kinase
VRVQHEKNLTDNIDEKEALLREIQHRTKNSFSLIRSLIELKSGRTNSEETKKTLAELILRISSISDLYSLLHETDSHYEVQLKPYCNKVIKSMLHLSNNITIKNIIEDITLPTKSAATIGMILVELLSNAIKYAFPDSRKGIINVILKEENDYLELIVEDNGVGLKKDFDIATIKSLGLQLVNLMVNQLDGKMEFITNKGTKIIIKIPFE